ncbi:response regulator transcription factor [Burkholderia stagnalis]
MNHDRYSWETTSIAVLDDDPAQGDVFGQTFRRAGYRCRVFREGKALQLRLRRASFDLLLLDWHLPDLSTENTLDWVRTLGIGPSVPIIFLATRIDEAAVTQALNAGADDYMVKPVSEAILLARIASVLRRARVFRNQGAVCEFDQFRFNASLGQAYFRGQPVSLKGKLLNLALLLFQHLDCPVSREHIIEVIWKSDVKLRWRTLDTHISLLRKRLGLGRKSGYRIRSIYGYGYCLERIASTVSG